MNEHQLVGGEIGRLEPRAQREFIAERELRGGDLNLPHAPKIESLTEASRDEADGRWNSV